MGVTILAEKLHLFALKVWLYNMYAATRRAKGYLPVRRDAKRHTSAVRGHCEIKLINI